MSNVSVMYTRSTGGPRMWNRIVGSDRAFEEVEKCLASEVADAVMVWVVDQQGQVVGEARRKT